MDEYGDHPQKDEDRRERLMQAMLLSALGTQSASFGGSPNIAIPPHLLLDDDDDDRLGE